MIHARGYRPYVGQILPPREAALRAICLAGLRRPWRVRGFKLVLVLAQVPALVYGVMLFVQAQILGEMPPEAAAMATSAAASGGAMPGPDGGGVDQAMRLFVDARFLLQQFLGVQMWGAAVIVALLAGADMIAGDIRANAMPLYFSRPVTRSHYLAGRIVPVMAYLSLVTLAPALALLITRLAFTSDRASFLKALPVAGPLLGGAALLAVAFSVVVLACSAAGGRNWVARSAFVAVWFLPAAGAAAVRSVAGTDAAGYASMPLVLSSLLGSLFGQPAPLHPAGAAASFALVCVAAVGFLYLRLGRAAELR